MAVVDPTRMQLVNLDTDEAFEVQFNPADLRESVSVNYTRHAVPGLSHQPLQYTGTGNRQIPGVVFWCDAVLEAERPTDGGIIDFRRFLMALTVPGEGKTRPPRVLFVWPGVLTVEAVVVSIEFAYARIGPEAVQAYSATVTFEEVLDVRRVSEQWRGFGAVEIEGG